ncbi:MAG: hypothetical protein AAGA87_03585 [Pseudomonadota bacterium]
MQNTDFTDTAIFMGVGVGIVSFYAFGGIAAVAVGAAMTEMALTVITARRAAYVTKKPSNGN